MQDFEHITLRLKQTKPRLNLSEVLELLLNTCDVDTLASFFSIIGIYLLSPETNYDGIIKCDPLYDKIVIVLNSGLQEKTTVAINLLCALLYINDSGQTKKKSLHVYVQNMIRISGCLTSMANLFTSFMMHRDTLKALCQCISEACRECAYNQTNCSHIVPLCIHRCRGGWSDMFTVLQSLVSGHSRNMHLFHDNNGMQIFTRESLHHPFCLQLLNTVVEETTSDNHNVVLESSHLFEQLREFLQRHGTSNALGQWISIILFSYQKVLRKYDKEKHVETIGNTNELKRKVYHPTRHVCYDKQDDTNELYRNILKEVIKIQNINTNHNKDTKHNNINHATAIDTSVVQRTLKPRHRINVTDQVQPAASNELSFSFLCKAQPQRQNTKKRCQTITDIPKSIRKTCSTNNSLAPSRCNQSPCNNTHTTKRYNASVTHQSSIDKDGTFYFAPPFVSTPKSRKPVETRSISQSSRSSIMKSIASKRKCHMRSRIDKTRPIKTTSVSRKLQNKSIGAKFIDIINGSCTTLVKSLISFKNIFRNKESECKISSGTSSADKLTSNSFTNYMRNRDEMSKYIDNNEMSLKRDFRSNDDFSGCNTCDDTIALRQKLSNETKLQQTVQRLKFGINLYGCDFKKISRTMWPKERYMTPSVLYNLYRKLIVK